MAFEATGSEVVGVAVDADGLVPDSLPQRATALLYLTPSHQFPTGHILSVERRETVAAWARRCGCYILEDDSDGEFRFEGSPIKAVAATAPDCTIYLGTFARTLGAGLKLGFMVLPPRLVEAGLAAKRLFDGGGSWLEQAALAEMMQGPSYSTHVTRVRAQYRENRDVLIAALRRNFGEVNVSGEDGGLHLLWRLPPGVPDADVVRALEALWRVPIDSLPFRANIYIDGARPWEEFDWIGRDVGIGGATFTVGRKNGRCGATNVNPATGERDLDIPSSLRLAFGHKNLGVYLTVREGGLIAAGDRLALSGEAEAPAEADAPAPDAARGRFICRGCYYIYDEAQGGPAWRTVRRSVARLALPRLRDGQDHLSALCGDRSLRAGHRHGWARGKKAPCQMERAAPGRPFRL